MSAVSRSMCCGSSSRSIGQRSQKYVRDPETFSAELTPDERRVWADNRAYQRAALGTSGAVLPSPLDPSIVLNNSGAVDPMRAIARTDTTIAKEKRYITSAGSTFSFDAELTEVSDDTFIEAAVTITNHKAQGWIQASIEVWEDQPHFTTEVAKTIGDGKARQPVGYRTGLIDGDRMLRRPFVENSSVDPYSVVNAAVTATNRVLFVGDFDHYVICDRVGLAVHFVPPGVLQNTANNLPDGRVGWYAYWRVGADVLTTAAFRMLDVQTTA
jgi:predicted phage gp36 major capsid-like protein